MIRRLIAWIWKGEPWRGAAYWQCRCEQYQDLHRRAMHGWDDERLVAQELGIQLARQRGKTAEFWTREAERAIEARKGSGRPWTDREWQERRRKARWPLPGPDLPDFWVQPSAMLGDYEWQVMSPGGLVSRHATEAEARAAMAKATEPAF
jgi:hypothetical protein